MFFLFYVFFDVESESKVRFGRSPLFFVVIKIMYYRGIEYKIQAIRTNGLNLESKSNQTYPNPTKPTLTYLT